MARKIDPVEEEKAKNDVVWSAIDGAKRKGPNVYEVKDPRSGKKCEIAESMGNISAFFHAAKKALFGNPKLTAM